jgi:tetratricopeptide (TPR) repeat protein
VEKDRFLFLVKNFTSLSEKEAVELEFLLKDYPYSQVIHNLATRVAQDNQLKIYNKQLQLSAVYTTDRSVLKNLMTQPRGTIKEIKIPVSDDAIEEQVVEEQLEITSPLISFAKSTLSGNDLIHEIEFDLARLKESKHNFELSIEEFDKATAQLPVEKKKVKSKSSSDSSPDDGLIEEIKITKKEINPEGEKQIEQINIIDQFIKSSPTISRAKPTPTSEDLTENNSAFTDHIISETLVEILLKQGKKEKAIEVLRKLIWKFPQKKAIFAAQIEDLKK